MPRRTQEHTASLGNPNVGKREKKKSEKLASEKRLLLNGSFRLQKVDNLPCGIVIERDYVAMVAPEDIIRVCFVNAQIQ